MTNQFEVDHVDKQGDEPMDTQGRWLQFVLFIYYFTNILYF